MGSAHIYDLGCSPEALKAAAGWALRRYPRSRWEATDVALAKRDGRLYLRTDEHRGWVPSEEEGDSRWETLTITVATLREAAKWAMPNPNAADVYLLADDRMLLVYQGDARVGFDTDGSPASEEYLAVAPLDR
jgi:hypothetical protein